jgi:hypothetical protein
MGMPAPSSRRICSTVILVPRITDLASITAQAVAADRLAEETVALADA